MKFEIKVITKSTARSVLNFDVERLSFITVLQTKYLDTFGGGVTVVIPVCLRNRYYW